MWAFNNTIPAMTALTLDSFDTDELFHLALQKSQTGAHDEAIHYLKAALTREPQARTHYLLGAEYAEIGMRERAIDQISQALVLDNSLHMASYQLGLLHFLNGDNDPARSAWKPLLHLPTTDPLHHLGRGLIAVLDSEPTIANEALRTAKSLNNHNPALERDIDNLLRHLEKNDLFISEESTNKDALNQFLISRYER